MSDKTIIANCVMTLSESNSLSHFYLTETDWTGKCLHIGETADRVLGHLQCQKMVTCLRFVLLLFGSKWIKSKVKTLSSIKLFILLLIYLLICNKRMLLCKFMHRDAIIVKFEPAMNSMQIDAQICEKRNPRT